MQRRFIALVFVSVFLAACASSSKAPVRSGDGEGVRINPKSGPVIEANVERLYPNKRLFVCQGTTVSNKPPTNGSNEVTSYSRMIVVDGKVPIVTAPANNACVSSGFGQRWGRLHKGLDITSRPASRVFSGGAGTILEAGQNGGYGLAILIDHGHGVYTRYAHLEYIEPGIKKGAYVHYGKPLGRMGRSGQVTGIHLHYEILTGTYQAGVWGRGLDARDPFSFPEWIDPRLE
ncbi:M23 family metallopeptidase [Ponticaulis profundi]|uniref:M23 family metallopeptidase n=1 Tax=Ponticaulis profundi TaxID=2665222 RepID=A0ABW1S519_9PROT